MSKPLLTGKRILITRAREQSAAFASRLRNLGAEVIEFPTIEIVPPLRWERLDQALRQLNSYDWIIFTSVNGVNFFWQRLKTKRKAARLPSSLKVCAIGPATAKQVKEKGMPLDYVPKEFIAEAILQGFEKMAVRGKRVLLARARIARDVLPKGLRKMGAAVDVAEVYRTVKPKGASKRLKALLTEEKIDAIAFTSSSTVNHFVELLKKEDLKRLVKGIAIACIGPVTARTARKMGMKVAIQPGEYTIPALAQAMVEYFSPHPSSLPRRLCRKSVHGSTEPVLSRRSSFESLRTNGESKGSPRTNNGTLKINCLAVRPEPVEGRQVNCDTVSRGNRAGLRGFK